MYETLVVILGTVMATLTGIFVLSRGPKQLINQVYAVMTFAFVVLIIANSFTLGNRTSAEGTLIFIRIVAAATTIAFTALYILVKLIGNGRPHLISDKKYRIIIGVSLVIFALDLSPLVFRSISAQDGQLTPVPGIAIILFVAHAAFFLGASIVTLVTGTRKGDAVKKSRTRSILIGLIPVLVFAPLTSIILPIVFHRVGFIFLSPVYIVFFVAMVAYAMVRQGLFDMRLAALRTFAYILTLATLSFIYYLLAYYISVIVLRVQNQAGISLLSPLHILLALVLAFVFQPIKRLFDRLTNLTFYRDAYDTTEFFARITRKTSTMTDLYALLRYASQDISSTLKAQFGAFSIHESGKRPIFVSTIKNAHVPLKDLDMLGTYVTKMNASIVMTDHLALTAEDRSIQRMLKSHRVALALPVILEGSVSGFLFLGEHLSSQYANRDVKALYTIADELGIAIRNALSIHEVQSLNANLEQRIETATRELRASNAQLQKLDEAKDEFISMASHQLRTPLTSIKGYVSMLMDGDVGEVSKEQKHLLQEAFMSSERMVRLIGDFLNVSRLQTGKFVIDKHPVDLSKVISDEVESLKTNAQSRGLKFAYKKPKNIPKLELDENKIQQVIMNFCDNAIYYSKENSKIQVNLVVVDNQVEFTVKDTGIGVPADEQEQLFNKFFRATNARKQRPDGTGVGLFLAKKVIDAHGGKIIFESKERIGSTFGFRLPIKKY